MLRTFLRCKIHRATVTQADLHYEGSIAIDPMLLEAAGIAPFEKVEIYNITNGNRLSTYTITGQPGSGQICINGAAARLVDPQDQVIICCYGEFHEDELAEHRIRVIHVNEQNEITRTEIKQPCGQPAAAADPS
jgi:aspartate 1-decarboxylase